jgi:hypothetical protein
MTRINAGALTGQGRDNEIGAFARVEVVVRVRLQCGIETPFETSESELAHLVRECVAPPALNRACFAEVGHVALDRALELVDPLAAYRVRRDQLLRPTALLMTAMSAISMMPALSARIEWMCTTSAPDSALDLFRGFLTVPAP